MSNSKSWLNTAVIYNLMIDRFARGGGEKWLETDHSKPVFCGGNLQGVIDKLDYLQELGINTILLTPFHPTSAYHGYHVLDFFGIDPRFGDLDTMTRLLADAHARGMHVMMDFVIGHVSSQHPYFEDARANSQSKYRDWFQFYQWPDDYLSFLNFYHLPKLNQANHEVKHHLLEAARYWIDLGFDGLRLDHVVGVSHRFLKELHAAIRAERPQAVLIGEAVQGKIRWSELKTLRLNHKLFLYLWGNLNLNMAFFIQLQYTKYLDGVLDFFFRDMIMSFYLRKAWYKPMWLLPLILKIHYAFYPKSFSLITLLDDADDDRFSYFLNDDTDTLKKVVAFQFKQKHPALVYYGSETGVKQTESRLHKVYGDKPHGDLASRATMNWNKIDAELLNFYRGVTKNKKN